MNRELIIDSNLSEVSIALLEDKSLVELNKEQINNNFAVGDVFLAKVKKIMPGLNAAFVDVGYEKDAFLHYLDLGPQIRTFNKYVKLGLLGKAELTTHETIKREKDIDKSGKITQVLVSGQQLLVQIVKEPISTKGPRISTEISFPGRYVVLLPFSSKVSISQKIKSKEERNRLKRLIASILPKNYGIIIRTVAENRKVAELDTDLRDLVNKWEGIIKKLHNTKSPKKVLSELDRTSQILRDVLNESFNTIHVNDPNLADEIKTYIETIAPDKKDIVKRYRGKVPIFEYYGIEKQLRSSFGKNVTIKSGVYLVIEHTEALHVIDINSGHRVNKENTQEQNALIVNMEAATEVARQLRLRDMGGIIVVDFIDLHEAKNRRALHQRLVEEMAKDHAKHTILPPSKFGLVQITRQRVRPEMIVPVLETCPTCSGTGQIKSGMILIDEIENNLNYLINDQNERGLTLAVHPYIYAFITKGLLSHQMRWYQNYKRWIKVCSEKDYQIMQFQFRNKNGDVLKH
ncbi:MAG: Rne/Rng family ribonuclease [Bacteroidales bacterium]|nr:ribonuclease E/G [Lentimicrobiaceae bacterium]MDG1135593.1 Rne/Rng family ribonuclease [Bacteroidales bacterium]MDG1901683.1 Rne/Rng family ribonuclease [Bacteroidales bacterium]MDG2081787.1 Rne/Rng family ribonuclease [Bacteroidales bacterium]